MNGIQIQYFLAMWNLVLIEQLVGSKDKGISQSTTTEKVRFESEWMADSEIITIIN